MGSQNSSFASVGNTLRSIAFFGSVHLYKRYCGSFIGVGWSLLNPASQVLLFYFALSYVLRVPIDHYGFYLASGLIPWSFLVQALSNSAMSLTARRDQFLSFPQSPAMVVAGDVWADFVGFGLALGLLTLGRCFTSPETWRILFIMPVVILPLVIFAFSTGLVLSYMAVPFRDVPHLLQLFLMTNFWAIPITYHWSMVSDPTLSLLVKWHPLALLLAPIQVTLQSGSQPSMAVTTAAFSIAIVALAAALVLNALKRRTFILQI